MDELAWFVGCHFQSLVRREHDWVFAFDNETSIAVECLWRLVECGRIRFTSEDDGQLFGHSSPVNVATEVNDRLARAVVQGVRLSQGLLDLDLRFSTGHHLQIVPNSSGFEAWTVSKGSSQFIAVGGGDLVIFGDGGNGR